MLYSLLYLFFNGLTKTLIRIFWYISRKNHILAWWCFFRIFLGISVLNIYISNVCVYKHKRKALYLDMVVFVSSVKHWEHVHNCYCIQNLCFPSQAQPTGFSSTKTIFQRIQQFCYIISHSFLKKIPQPHN